MRRARTQRARDDANQTIARRRLFDEDIEQAKTAVREASLVAKRSQQALDRQLRRLWRELARPPRPRRACRVSHPSNHDPGTTPA